MGFRWQISAGELFELLRPAVWVLATLVSAWVLADARRGRFAFYSIAAWTLGTLFFPPIILPLYLIVRAYRPTRERANHAQDHSGDETEPTSITHDGMLKWRWALPLLYAWVVLSLVGLSLFLDYRSIDAHLARANQSRLLGQREKTIREYRAALKLEDNAHTHNLLAIELDEAARWEEALAEFRAAERGGEPDETIPFRIANALDALKRPDEAAFEYRKFLQGQLCIQTLPDTRCEMARARLKTTEGNPVGTSTKN